MISIIIPTYNRSKLLFLCLESILLQTYKDIEIILLDDGSTDNTRLIVSNFKDKRLVYVNIGRIGNISKLRNIGINLSKGEYIAFCDDDDVWKVNKLEIQMELINNYDFICSNAEVIDINGKIKFKRFFTEFNHDLVLNPQYLFLRNYIITSTVLINKSIICDEPFDTINFKSTAEDYDLWVKLSLKHQIAYIYEPLIKYRFHDNLTFEKSNLPIIYNNSIKIIDKYRNMISIKNQGFAIFGMNKFRVELIKLSFYKKNYFIVFLESIKFILNFRFCKYCLLVVHKVFHPKLKVIDLLKKQVINIRKK